MANQEEPQYRSFLERNGMIIDRAIVAQPIPSMGGGFGIVATRNLRANDTIVKVPHSMLITAKLARSALSLPASVPPIGAICLWLVKLRLECIVAGSSSSSSEQQQPSMSSAGWGAASRYGLSMAHLKTRVPPNTNSTFLEWIARLPPQYDNLLEVPEPLLKHLPLPPRYREKVGQEIQNWRNLFARMQPHFPQIPGVVSAQVQRRRDELNALLVNDDGTTDAVQKGVLSNLLQAHDDNELKALLFRWAYNSLMSRGFGHDDEVWAMMPWVDYFNYSNEDPSLTLESGPRGSQEFRVKRPVRQGEQILYQYGAYTDFELALWYGFTLCSLAHSDEGQQQTNNHQRCCAYCFSPTSDANGDAIINEAWILQMAKDADIIAPRSVPRLLDDLTSEGARITRKGISSAFRGLLITFAMSQGTLEVPPNASGFPSRDPPRAVVQCCLHVARKIFSAELNHLTSGLAHWEGSRNELLHGDEEASRMPMLAHCEVIARDGMDLMQVLVGLDDAALARYLGFGVPRRASEEDEESEKSTSEEDEDEVL